MAAPPDRRISLHGVGHTLPDGRVLFDNITETLHAESIALIGRNGCGKSTLGRIVAGLLAPSRGRIDTLARVRHVAQDDADARVRHRSLAALAGLHRPLDALRRLEAGQGTAADVEAVGERWDLESHWRALLAHTGLVERLEVYNPSVGPGPFLGVSAQIEQGQSGGPVIDRWGRAVGVVTWTWRDQKGGFAIPIAEAARMLAERPKLDTDVEQHDRAEARAKSYLAALGAESSEELRRLTSPSRAREVRDATIDVLLDKVIEGTMLRSFVTSIEELLASAASGHTDPFPMFEHMIEGMISDATMRKLGVQGAMSKDAVAAFFYEIGAAYMAARWFGEVDQYEALMVAVQRVHSLDTARNITLLEVVDALSGVRATIETVELSPSFHTTQATATVDIGQGKTASVKMRLEWGDWYVVGVELVEGPTKMRSVGVQKRL